MEQRVAHWDGAAIALIDATVEHLPSGILVSGHIMRVGATGPRVLSGTVAAPARPATGTLHFIVEANPTTGQLAVKQDPAAIPTPDPGNVTVVTQTIRAAP